MTTTTSSPPTSLDPDEECLVCGVARDQHGDRHHKFSTDGQLIPIEPAAPPRQQAPDAVKQVLDDPVAAVTLRLIERMIDKGQLDGDDLIRIFGGDPDAAHNRGQAGAGPDSEGATSEA